MKSIPVSWLSNYLYCKRKLYLEQVRKLKIFNTESLIKGQIRHSIFNKINSVDKTIVESIKSFKKLDEIQMIFRKEYFDLAKQIIDENRMRLFSIGLNTTDFFHEIWPSVLKEVDLRSKNIFNFIIREKIYGRELWSKLFPKYLSEVNLVSDKLRGKIDRIEVYSDYMVPVELKTNKAPKEGVWLGDRVQIGAYMFLVEKEFEKKIDYGFINYLESGEIRKVENDEFIEDFLSSLLEDIDKTLKGPLPDFVKNKNKCDNCSLKEKCYNLEE